MKYQLVSFCNRFIEPNVRFAQLRVLKFKVYSFEFLGSRFEFLGSRFEFLGYVTSYHDFCHDSTYAILMVDFPLWGVELNLQGQGLSQPRHILSIFRSLTVCAYDLLAPLL